MKKVMKTILVVFGLITIATAIWGVTADIAENDIDFFTAVGIFNLIAWPILILCITGLMRKIADWWETH